MENNHKNKQPETKANQITTTEDDITSLRFFELNMEYLAKWLLLATITGLAGGFAGALFSKLIRYASSIYRTHSYMKFLLPISGLATVFMYKALHEDINKGTNMVILAIHSSEPIHKKQGLLIFISAIMSHFGGASVGKEGAALQIGGNLGTLIADAFRLDEYDKKIMIMTGMSALFGSVFGTPIGAAIFPIEVVSIGVMYYTALFPCIISSFFGAWVARKMSAPVSIFRIMGKVGALAPEKLVMAVIIGILCAVMSVLFTDLLKNAGKLYNNLIPNPYIRILVGAGIFTILISIFSPEYYSGTGARLIDAALYDYVPPYAFLIKMLMTAVVIGAGFKGGEIVPTLAVGACFGATLGVMLNLDTHFAASLGMLGLFAGMTNCPIASTFMAIEMFGAKGAPYYGIVICLAYALSGYKGLYDAQRFMYGKIKAKYINK